MKKALIALAAVSAAVSTAPAFAADPAPAAAPAPGFSVETSTIGDLLDNADAKAVLDKHMPGFSGNEQISMARSMTLKQIQGFAPDRFSDELLGKIDTDLKAIKK
jgi:para-nitrobenzyl esterase